MKLFPKEKAYENLFQKPEYFQVYFLCIVFCFWFSTYIYVPVFGVYLDFLNFGYYEIGLVMGSYGIMQIALRLPLGIIAEKYKIDGKLLVAFGFLTAIISVFLLALSHQFLRIFLGRLLAGVTAAMWVIITIWYSSSFEKKQSLKAMGHLQATTVASQFISMALSGWIGKLMGYTSLFWISEFFAIIGLFLVILLPGAASIERIEKKQAAKPDEQAVVQLFKDRKLWSLSVLSMLSHAVLFTTIFGFSPVYFDSLNSHSSAIVLLIISFMLPHTLAPMFMAKKKGSLPKPFFVMFCCFCIAAGSLFLLSYTDNWIIYCLLHAVFGLFLGFIFPILLDQVYKIENLTVPKIVMGFYQSVYSIGIVSGPIAAGYMARQMDMKYIFIMSAMILLFGGLVSLMENNIEQNNA